MNFSVEPFGPQNREDFFEFHSRIGGVCFCTAWWMRTWQEFMEASPEDTRATRESLLEHGEYDGYLIYEGEKVIGWCQVGQRDRLAKILEQFKLKLDPKTWAITCFQIDPAYQRKGVSSELLKTVLRKLSEKGIKRVEAFPKIDIELAAHQQWTGPKALFEHAGFELVRENNTRAVYAIELDAIPISELTL